IPRLHRGCRSSVRSEKWLFPGKDEPRRRRTGTQFAALLEKERTLKMSVQTEDRQRIISKAAAQYESAGPTMEKLTSRENFINDALRVCGHRPLAAQDTGAVETTGGKSESKRSILIANCAKEWDGTPDLQKIVSKRTYVNGTIIAAKLPRLSDQEEQI